MRLPLFLVLLSLPWGLQAAWRVEPDLSRVSFVSLKRGERAEVQRFTEIRGEVDDHGTVRVLMPFAKLDSGLALRNERQRDLLFETERFPHAELESQVDLGRWERLPVGEAQVETLTFQLDLHGHRQRLKAEVMVSRLDETRVQVATLEPVVIKAALFALTPGLDKLKEVANLPSIASEVPVSAVIAFQRSP